MSYGKGLAADLGRSCGPVGGVVTAPTRQFLRPLGSSAGSEGAGLGGSGVLGANGARCREHILE
jgi:hypothetical protein